MELTQGTEVLNILKWQVQDPHLFIVDLKKFNESEFFMSWGRCC